MAHKYKVFQKVWVMKGNKAVELSVDHIQIIIRKSPYYPKESDALDAVCSYMLSDSNIYPENEIYKSKDELLLSL